MPAIPFYLIFAVDPPAAGAGFRVSHFSYEADRRGTTTLGAAVKEVLDRDTYPLESVWLCNPGRGRDDGLHRRGARRGRGQLLSAAGTMRPGMCSRRCTATASATASRVQ
jgi:hypothetical protein